MRRSDGGSRHRIDVEDPLRLQFLVNLQGFLAYRRAKSAFFGLYFLENLLTKVYTSVLFLQNNIKQNKYREAPKCKLAIGETMTSIPADRQSDHQE